MRSTGLSVAVGAIRSRRDRHQLRASPQSPNWPNRARLKPPGSPASTRTRARRAYSFVKKAVRRECEESRGGQKSVPTGSGHGLPRYLHHRCTPTQHDCALHSCVSLVDSRQFVSPRPPPYARYACLPAFSPSHVMFHNSARADEATRIPTSQWQSPDPTPSPRHVRAPYSYSMSVHTTP